VHPDREAEPGTERWWPADLFGATTDPCNVYYGAAGILGVLAAAYAHRQDPELGTATARAARWLERHAAREPEVLPGLHFGRSGTYWALLEAGIALGDEDLIVRTADAAGRLPVAGPVPDVSHGIAGSGLTALRFWRHTGRASFRRQAGACADTLLAAAVADRRASPGRCPLPSAFARRRHPSRVRARHRGHRRLPARRRDRHRARRVPGDGAPRGPYAPGRDAVGRGRHGPPHAGAPVACSLPNLHRRSPPAWLNGAGRPVV
jgi:hypothetical protein